MGLRAYNLPVQSDVSRRRKRRDGEATRERILAATIELLSEEGLGGVSTGRLASKAGVVQSGFYAHFASLDECVLVAAERIGGRLRDLLVQRMYEEDTVDPDSLARFLEELFARFEPHWTFVELMLRYRRDPSPLGKVMRDFYDRVRQDLLENLTEVAPELNVQEHERRLLAPAANSILTQFVAALEGIKEGWTPDRETLAKHLAEQIQLFAQQGYETVEAHRAS